MAYLESVNCQHTQSLTLAEHFKDWVNDSIYHDLVLFEDDIASISSLIIIILESAGALTELGLFTKNESLKNKLLIFVNDTHYHANSFVKLGPLRHLEKARENSVCAYPWDENDLDNSLKNILSEMHQDITNTISTLEKDQKFDIANKGHLAFIIYELIKIFRALIFTEIESFLGKIGITLAKDELKKLLFLLNKFELVKSLKRGNLDYYYAHVDTEKISFGGHFDKTAARMSAMQFYVLTPTEGRRLNAINSVFSPIIKNTIPPTAPLRTT